MSLKFSFRDSRISERHPNAPERARTKKRQHPTLKIHRIITAQSWKRNAFAAAVVRLPLTTETQIQSRSTHTLHPVTHTCTLRRILAHATHTSTNRRIITHSHLQLKLRSFPTELFNLFFFEERSLHASTKSFALWLLAGTFWSYFWSLMTQCWNNSFSIKARHTIKAKGCDYFHRLNKYIGYTTLHYI